MCHCDIREGPTPRHYMQSTEQTRSANVIDFTVEAYEITVIMLVVRELHILCITRREACQFIDTMIDGRCARDEEVCPQPCMAGDHSSGYRASYIRLVRSKPQPSCRISGNQCSPRHHMQSHHVQISEQRALNKREAIEAVREWHAYTLKA